MIIVRISVTMCVVLEVIHSNSNVNFCLMSVEILIPRISH